MNPISLLLLVLLAAVWLPILTRMPRTAWSGITDRLAFAANQLGELDLGRRSTIPHSRLQSQLDELDGEHEELQAQFEASGRQKMLASEQREYDRIVKRESEVLAQLRTSEAVQRRREADGAARVRTGMAGGVFARGADTVYARGNGLSYFADLAAMAMPGHPNQLNASRRLAEHAEVVERAAEDLPPEFRATHERGAATEWLSGREQRVNPNRTDGQGGNFVPPLWLIDDYVDLLRNGRATADRCNLRPLPGGTDNVMLPKVATGTLTAVQAADAGAVASQDLTDASISGPVKTIAGQQDLALQLFEQSPVNFDDIVFADLTADYNQQLCQQVVAGTGAAGQVTGILPTAGVNAITYTDATPTLPEMLIPIAQGLSQAARLGKRSPDSIVTHPMIWYWFTTQLDTTNRPLVDLGNGMNSIAVYDANAVSGVAGSIGTVPIVVDLNMPTNLGAGTNETRIIEGAMKEVYLWEGVLRTRALVEVLSGTLQVRLQVYNYLALIANRRPAALSVVSGTGLIPPAGF